MRLLIMVPSKVMTDTCVKKVIAEGEEGYFCLLPRHIDFVSSLDAGILSYVTKEGKERFAAVDEGILVKKGDIVRVSSANAMLGELSRLRDIVEDEFKQRHEREKKTRSVLSKLEIDTMRRFAQLGQNILE